MSAQEPMSTGELTQRINELNGSMYRAGWTDALAAFTNLLVVDEIAGVSISQQRVLAHLRVLTARGTEVSPPASLT